MFIVYVFIWQSTSDNIGNLLELLARFDDWEYLVFAAGHLHFPEIRARQGAQTIYHNLGVYGDG